MLLEQHPHPQAAAMANSVVALANRNQLQRFGAQLARAIFLLGVLAQGSHVGFDLGGQCHVVASVVQHRSLRRRGGRAHGVTFRLVTATAPIRLLVTAVRFVTAVAPVAFITSVMALRFVTRLDTCVYTAFGLVAAVAAVTAVTADTAVRLCLVTAVRLCLVAAVAAVAAIRLCLVTAVRLCLVTAVRLCLVRLGCLRG